MEIIRKGTFAKDQKRTATCPSCRCKFRFSLAESELVHDQRDGDFRWVTCPEGQCRNKFTVQP